MRTTTRNLAVALAGATMLALAAPASAQPSDIVAARQATAAYHSTAQAAADGWGDSGLPCFDDASGGMGFHWLKAAPNGDVPSAAKPQALVYEPEPDGSLQLVAVEYLVDRAAWYANDPDRARPRLFDRSFEPIDIGPLHLFELHAYLWRNNPNGMFTDFNPKVRMCP